MLIGEFRHNLDAKGRVIIPAKFRDKLADDIILTVGLDTCIKVLTKEQFLEQTQLFEKLPDTNREVRKYIRVQTAMASEGEIDKQGRILIPSHLIREAKIGKECAIIGYGKYFEIWDVDLWNAYLDDAIEGHEETAERITDFLP